jgi:hypothetical protein
MFDPNNPYDDGVWRDLATGVNPEFTTPEEANAANDGPGTPPGPIETRLEGPYGMPWFEGLEDPYGCVEIPQSATPLPWSPNEDVGGVARLSDYEGAYRTSGPVVAFGHEVSGGLAGDQAIGRIMRFPANIPDRFDPYGVFNTDLRDDLAGAMAVDELEQGSTAEITTSLLQWPNVWGRW